MKFDVTFFFESCSPTVTVDAADAIGAVRKARERDYPPVPNNIPARCTYSGAGGKRDGAGVKEGSTRTDHPRTVKKQIRWKKREWETVVEAASKEGLGVAAYQRGKVLS